MMEIALPGSWKEEFARAAAYRRDDILYQEKMKRFEDRQRENREFQHKEEERRDAETAELIGSIFAPKEEIVAFRTQLDTYDTRTVEALMDNQEALDAVRRKLDTMLGEAYVLPDGRRVFKTRDGQRVFDEHGAELPSSIIDPKAIEDARPRWESFESTKKTENALVSQREELLDYQKKLDTARERVNKGQVTEKELDGMKDELAATMPDAVRRKLGVDAPKAETVAQPASPEGIPADMDKLLRQTAIAIRSPAQ